MDWIKGVQKCPEPPIEPIAFYVQYKKQYAGGKNVPTRFRYTEMNDTTKMKKDCKKKCKEQHGKTVSTCWTQLVEPADCVNGP